MNEQELFDTKLNTLFDMYNMFRFHAENRLNMLKITQKTNPNPSDGVEVIALEQLLKNINRVFPHSIPLQDFKKELALNHNFMNRMIELRDTSPLSHEDLIVELLKFTGEKEWEIMKD